MQISGDFMSKYLRTVIAIILLPFIMAGISLPLAVVVYQDTTWSAAYAWYPVASLIALILIVIIGIPILFFLKFIRLPASVAYILSGVAALAIGLGMMFPYTDYWHSFWAYWISGALTGLVGWLIFETKKAV